MQNPIHLDVRGLHCPLPILKAKKMLLSMTAGEKLEVWATDEEAVQDFEVFTQRHGHLLLISSRSGDTFTFLIEKGQT